MAVKRFRIFVSSPSDVFAERERLDRVIARLNGEFGADLLEAIRWERSYYSAAKTFQDQIPLPSQTDLVVCIFWKRLGFELPVDYRRPDGTTPTGSEYEFEDAIAAARSKGEPDVLVYRKVAPVLLSAEDVDLERAQLDALKQFWTRWFQTESGHFTAAYQTFDNTDAFERQVEDHIRQWLARRSVASAGITWPIAEYGSPFRGLLAFEARHAAVFFGRRRIVERARERLADAATRGAPFLLVLGTSGSGKSSLARAGLLPRITQPGAITGVDLWRSVTFRPSEAETPLDALARALYAPDALPELAAGDCPAPADLARLLADAPDAAVRGIARALQRATAEIAKREAFDRPVEARLLILVDQFEEALRDPAHRDPFARALHALAGAGTWIVATMRSDLYALFQLSPPLMALRDAGAQLDLTAPGPGEIAEIITGPAAAAGLTYEKRPDGVSLDELLAHAAGPGELPLLQLALQALFEARDTASNTLTFAAYNALGGLTGVVERRAEATLATIDPASQAALPPVLRTLVDVADDGVITSRAAPPPTDPASTRLIDAFVDARLLVLDARAPVPDGPHDERLLRVAHESLLSGWPRAADILAEDREMLRTRGRVQSAARRWIGEARNADFLLPHGRPLAEAVELAVERPETLDLDAVAFVQASRQADDDRAAAVTEQANRELRLQADAQAARADAAARVVRRTRAAVAVVSVLLVLAAGAAVFAMQQRGQALAQSAEAHRQEQQARAQRARAETNFAAALAGSAKLMDVVTAHLRDGGMTRDVSRALLDDAGGSLDQLGDAGAATPPLLDARARLLGSLATVQDATCDSDGAIRRATESVRLAQAALAAEPTPERRVALVQRLATLGDALTSNKEFGPAETTYAQAETAAGTPEPGTPLETALQSVRRNRAFLATSQGKFDAAAASYRADAAWIEHRLAATPDDLDLLDTLALDRRHIGFILIQQHHEPEAAPILDAEAATLHKLLDARPDNLAWQRALSINAGQRAQVAAAAGDKDAAIAGMQEMVAAAQQIAARDRGNGEWQLDAILASSKLSAMLRRFKGVPEAMQALLPAIDAVDALDRASANSIRCRTLAASMRTQLSLSLYYGADYDRAAQQFIRTAALIGPLAETNPEQLTNLETAEIWAARSYRAAKDSAAAIPHNRAAIAIAQRILAQSSPQSPGQAAAHQSLDDARLDLADNLARTGDVDGAAREYETTAAEAAQQAAIDPKNPAWQHQQVVALLRAANAFNANHRDDDQWDALQRVLLAARRERAIDPSSVDAQLDEAEALQTLAIPQYLRGQKETALASARESVTLAETRQQAAPKDFHANQRLAFALLTLGTILKLENQPEQSADAMQRAAAAYRTVEAGLAGPTE